MLAKAAEETARRNAVAAIDMATRSNGLSMETRQQLSALAASLQTQSEVVAQFNQMFGRTMQRLHGLEERVAMLEEADDASDG